jgi:hypothetical protein
MNKHRRESKRNKKGHLGAYEVLIAELIGLLHG